MQVLATPIIKSENDFFDFLNTIKDDPKIESTEFKLPNIKFEGWPNIHIDVKGKKYHASVTTNMSVGMYCINEEIQRAYSLIKYGVSNLNKLTIEDKQLLDIVFNIKEGSSDVRADNSGILNNVIDLFKGKMGKMNGWQTTCVIIAITFALGHYSYDNNRKEIEIAKEHNSSTKKVTDAMAKQLELILSYQSKGSTEISSRVMLHGAQGRNQFIKNIANDPSVASVSINQKVIERNELNLYNARQQIEKIATQLVGNFTIKGIDRTGVYLTDFNIRVIRISDGESFTIKAPEELISQQELSDIALAWSRPAPILIHYTEIKDKAGNILIGTFIKVEKEKN